MKKVTILVIIGKNDVVKETGCPLHNDKDPAYDEYIGELIKGHCLIVPENILGRLSQPLLDCHIYLLSNEGAVHIEPQVTNMSVVLSIEGTVTECTDTRKVFMVTDAESYREMMEFHKKVIDEILVVQLDEDVEGTWYFEPPSQFEWRPIIQDVPTAGTSSPLSFNMTCYAYQPLHL